MQFYWIVFKKEYEASEWTKTGILNIISILSKILHALVSTCVLHQLSRAQIASKGNGTWKGPYHCTLGMSLIPRYFVWAVTARQGAAA